MSKTFEILSQKQSAMLPAKQFDNPWLEVASEVGNDFGKLLKFVKGKWETGDDTVPDGTERAGSGNLHRTISGVSA